MVRQHRKRIIDITKKQNKREYKPENMEHGREDQVLNITNTVRLCRDKDIERLTYTN